MFEMKSYLRSGVWAENDLLIDPADGAKRCACCGVRYYAVDFPEFIEFEDGALPVCIFCFKSTKARTAVDEILAEYDVYRTCAGKDSCGLEKHFTEFLKGYRKARNDFGNLCQDCRPVMKEWWKNPDSE